MVVHVQDHAFFRRDSNDLFCEMPVHFTTLALGGDIQVPTLDGTKPLSIPHGTQTGATFRLKGLGMPDVSGRGTGDLHVAVKALTPRKLSKEQKKLFEQLATTLPDESQEPTPAQSDDDRGLFDRVKDIFG